MTHYYTPVQTSELVLHKVKGFLRGREFEMLSSSGVFASKKIDKATALLINNAELKDGWRVLDLGCGCGVVGVVVATEYSKCDVIMSDVNKRAVKISRMNVKKLKNAKVVESDLFQKIEGEFDTILVNPPMVAGRSVCYKMIEESKEHLKPKGLLQLVARHQKGGKQLAEKMKEVFGNVKEIAKKGGFRVYVSEN